MCGVIAYVSDSPNSDDLELMLKIFEESRIRGVHSFGYCFASDTPKRFHRIDEMRDSLAENWDGSPLVGHNRYCTGESWKDLLDCQPISRGELAIAFNGVIDMSSPASWPGKYSTNFETANDAEIALVYIESGGFLGLISNRKVSFAGAWVKDGTVWYARNPGRPLWLGCRAHSRFLASTKDILLRAGFDGKITEVPIMEVLKL